MPTKKGQGDLVLFSSTDPKPLVEWLCDTYGQMVILQEVAQYQPGGAEAPAKRAYKKRAPKQGSSRKSAKKTAKQSSKKTGGKKDSGKGNVRPTGGGGASEVGNGR